MTSDEPHGDGLHAGILALQQAAMDGCEALALLRYAIRSLDLHEEEEDER